VALIATVSRTVLRFSVVAVVVIPHRRQDLSNVDCRVVGSVDWYGGGDVVALR